MNRIVTALAFALSLASTSAVALADTGAKAPHQRGGDGAQFPMPAAQYQQRIREREGKARERLEKKLAAKKVPADRANEARAKLNAHQDRVNGKVAEVSADGTVTRDEAKQVKQVAREGRPQHKNGERKGQKSQG